MIDHCDSPLLGYMRPIRLTQHGSCLEMSDAKTMISLTQYSLFDIIEAKVVKMNGGRMLLVHSSFLFTRNETKSALVLSKEVLY